MYHSYCISFLLIFILVIIAKLISKYLILCLILYCVYEQIIFQNKRKGIYGSNFVPPIVGFLYESIYPKLENYSNLWKNGDLTATSVFGKFIVVCNSPEQTKKIFTDNTGQIQLCLIDSMRSIISPENFVFTIGQIHKNQRMNFISFLSKKNLEKYVDIQEETIKTTIEKWSNNFTNYRREFRLLNLTVFFKLFFGSSLNNKYYEEISNCLEVITSALQLVNFPIPIPGTNIDLAIKARKRIVEIFKETIINFRNFEEKSILNEFLTYRNNNSVRTVDEKKNNVELLENHDKLALAIFSFIFASQDALTSSVSWVISHLADKQDIQESLHSSSAEYLESFIKEVLRFRCPVIMVPHITMVDYKINSYVVPKNTILIPSIWACAHDEKSYKNPHLFDANRFSKNSLMGENKSDEKFMNAYVFGGGLHACLGSYYTMQHLLLITKTILKKFKIKTDKKINFDDVEIYSTSYPNKDVKFNFVIRE